MTLKLQNNRKSPPLHIVPEEIVHLAYMAELAIYESV